MQKVVLFLLLVLTTTMCKNSTPAPVIATETPELILKPAPEWSKNANIYEVNIRQYTPEGTINAFKAHLPRLKELGADILWLMPIFPVGAENRKGSMGSPYAVKDYKAVNPDFGTTEDFKSFIDEAHAMGFKVILDWVANHSAFDNNWALEHKDWYTLDEAGNITYPKGTDWTDVADLNYDNEDMRKAMIDALEYWVRDLDIDGYRCDVAGDVPKDFWMEAIGNLNNLKDVFMLAEADEPWLHEAGFHMTYGWGFHHVMNAVAQGKEPVAKIEAYLKEDAEKYKPEDYRMEFTTNHDENTWNGTISERMGAFGDAMNVLAFTVKGMPLIYSGQEAGLNKRVSFFEKDTIDFSDLSKSAFYASLLKLKHENESLWNGTYGAPATRIPTSKDDSIFAFERAKGEQKVLVLLNLSKKNQSFSLTGYAEPTKMTDLFTGKEVDLETKKSFTLGSGGYLVLTK
ncbi:MAG: alpha-glucosidase C-terminal domain-containing protein [Saprospiraceae bacterium]|nr:alpha-glucosidase C-terminal domain-containing protein [Saprospiraceae bacterium]MCB9324290.1 alpha-glucosidase C-terminal domain-containing protein [Lewinellaceae bacterium]